MSGDVAAVALPKWRSHKVVWADKITGVYDEPRRWVLACSGIVAVSLALQERVPVGDGGLRLAVGGYYVRYADGYESWSPAQAFEEGYTRVDC